MKKVIKWTNENMLLCIASLVAMCLGFVLAIGMAECYGLPSMIAVKMSLWGFCAYILALLFVAGIGCMD